jgi:hypothetical protein
MIRKLSDQEYKQLKTIALPAFQFAINTSFSSAIGCTPFEAGHGLAATTIAQARLQATRYATTAEGGRDGKRIQKVHRTAGYRVDRSFSEALLWLQRVAAHRERRLVYQ